MPHHLLPLLFVSFLCASLCHTHPVANADDLISLFKHATGNTLQTDIEVTADLDFSHHTLTLPLGAFSNGTCVSFSGVFQGNGHSIKGLKINSANKAGYNMSGLFCSLKNATVENLVIDSSCSFTGWYAGALSVSVTGSLTVKHITSNAAVSGTERVGGFIGTVQYSGQSAMISFEDCVNNGIVTGSNQYIGGFLGYVRCEKNTSIVISNSFNNGDVTASGTGGSVGGFAGYISGSIKSLTMTISNSVNSGKVAGDWNVTGFGCSESS